MLFLHKFQRPVMRRLTTKEAEILLKLIQSASIKPLCFTYFDCNVHFGYKKKEFFLDDRTQIEV